MKTLLQTAVISAIIATSATSCYVAQSTAQSPAYQQAYTQEEAPEISFNTFYDELTPYGRWVDYPQYGRVWIASQAGFTPYQTDGHWAYTSYGWTWVSDYNWGWAPFHYGRWSYDSFYGWFWVPGYEWAPAWVSWRSGGGYYGWAPLSPGINISIGASFGNIPQDYWCFVPSRYMGNNNMRNYYASRGNNVTIINNTTIINTTNQYRGARYLQGPDRGDVERNIGRRLQPMQVRDANRPGQQVGNDNINVYRPRVRQNDMERGTPGYRDNTPRPGQSPTRGIPQRDVPNGNTNPGNTVPPSRPYTPPANTPAIPERPRPATPQTQPSQPADNLPIGRPIRMPQGPNDRPLPNRPKTPIPEPATPQTQPAQPVNNIPIGSPPRVPQGRDDRPLPNRPMPPTNTPAVPERPRPATPQTQPATPQQQVPNKPNEHRQERQHPQ
jgi:hypothetical protein